MKSVIIMLRLYTKFNLLIDLLQLIHYLFGYNYCLTNYCKFI